MSATSIELPFFPFHLVLFPGTVLPLFIFEPRYRQMIADCIAEDKPFGIVLMKAESEPLNEEPYAIGTMAEIHNLRQQEDGCYHLMAVGVRRFRILSRHREKPYLSGLVEPYDDEMESEGELIRAVEQVRGLFETYLSMVLEATNEKE